MGASNIAVIPGAQPSARVGAIARRSRIPAIASIGSFDVISFELTVAVALDGRSTRAPAAGTRLLRPPIRHDAIERCERPVLRARSSSSRKLRTSGDESGGAVGPSLWH